MTTGHESRIDSRDAYLRNAAEFLRLAAQARARMVTATDPGGYSILSPENDVDMLVQLAKANIAMAAELRQVAAFDSSGSWRGKWPR